MTSRSWATLNDFPAIRDGYVKRDIIPDDAPSGARSLADADMAILSSATIASRLILMDDAAHAVPPT